VIVNYDSTSAAVAQHDLMDEKNAHATTRKELSVAIENNIRLLSRLRHMRETTWFKIGRFLGMIS
jgi:hypothetical protein